MPKKRMARRRPRRAPRRRNYNKRRMYKRSNKNFWGSPKHDITPLPKIFKTTLRYTENGVNVNPGLGTADSYVFSANGLYDVNVSGVGHQPVGFDQIMTMYQFYTVIGAKIRVMAVNADTSSHQIFGVYVSNSATEQTDPRVVIENGSAKYKTITPKNGSKDISQLVLSVCPHKWLGRPTAPLSDNELKGTSSGNPTKQVYFHIFAQDFVGSNDTDVVPLWVQIDYVVVFSEPKQLALS